MNLINTDSNPPNKEAGMPTWFAIVFFQLVWFLLIMGHQEGYHVVAVPAIVAYLVGEALLEKKAKQYYWLIIGLALLGMIADFAWAQLNLIQFSEPGVLPFWMVLIWILFAVTLKSSYQWMLSLNLFWRVGFGGIFGPLAYWLASRVSPVEILSPMYFTLLSSIFWMLYFGYFLTLFGKSLKTESLENQIPANE